MISQIVPRAKSLEYRVGCDTLLNHHVKSSDPSGGFLLLCNVLESIATEILPWIPLNLNHFRAPQRPLCLDTVNWHRIPAMRASRGPFASEVDLPPGYDVSSPYL